MALKIINWEEAMNQVGGDKDFLDEVLADLLTESQTAQEEIGGSIQAKDFQGVMKAAHRIKGSASYLCCEQLKAVSLKLQDAGHEGTQNTAKAAEILASIEALFTEFKVALEDLKNEIKNGGSVEAVPNMAATTISSGSIKIPLTAEESHS